MTTTHDRLTDEMMFHLSVKNGLDERLDVKLWSFAAGNARGLLLANECFETGTESESIEKLQRVTEDAMEKHRDPDDAVVPSPSSRMEKCLSLGYLQGLGRAWAIVNEERHVQQSGPPKDLSQPRHKEQTEVN